MPWPGSSAGQKISATRCGSIVTGTGPGAAIENITPVMSIRVAGPGRLAHVELLDEQGRDDLHAGEGTAAPPAAPTAAGGCDGSRSDAYRPVGRLSWWIR